MTGISPTSQEPQGTESEVAPSPAIQRANRMSAANMLRSLLPLVVLCLVIVGWTTLRQRSDEGVREVDPASTVQLAAARADYAEKGDPVTLEIGYLTPSEEYVGFVVSDDRRSAPLADVLDGGEEQGTVELGGQTWTRSTTERDETALVREDDGVTMAVTGSASDEELETIAASVRPYAG
jgi:hypothetical protein